MNPKKTAASKPEISRDEWDFRLLAKDTDLATVTEYEYLRSSKLKSVIEKWQSRLFGNTILTKDLWHIWLLRRAKLLTASDTSPLGRFEKKYGSPFDQVVDARGERAGCPPPLREKAERQMREIPWSLTTGQAIRQFLTMDAAALGNTKDETAFLIAEALHALESEMPEAVKKAHAEWYCLVFDRFPTPWLQLQREEEPAYLRRRFFCEEMETPPVSIHAFASDAPYSDAAATTAFRRRAFGETDAATPPRLPSLPDVPAYSDLPGTTQLAEVTRHVIVVNWNYRKQRIVEELMAWVNQMHTEGQLCTKGAPEHLGWLKRLSAHRLLREGKMGAETAWARARMNPLGNWDAVLTSQNRKTWHAAVSEAEAALEDEFISRIRQDFRERQEAATARPIPTDLVPRNYRWVE